jgi:hypothetical protein
MRSRLVVLIAAAVGACALADASSPAQAWCHYNSYGPCSGRAQYNYGYSYGYQYAQPYYQQQYYAQPHYQPPVYRQPVYQQPYYPQPAYAAPCCEPNWWEKLWGARNCCQQGYGQPGYAVEANASWNTNPSWPSSRDVQINNNGNVYVMRDGVSVSGEFGPGYAYAQPAPRYYRKRVYRHYHARPRAAVRTVYRTRVIYARPKPRPHAQVPGNPSTSAGTYEVAPKKVLRP